MTSFSIEDANLDMVTKSITTFHLCVFNYTLESRLEVPGQQTV